MKIRLIYSRTVILRYILTIYIHLLCVTYCGIGVTCVCIRIRRTVIWRRVPLENSQEIMKRRFDLFAISV